MPVRFTLAGANADPSFRESFEREVVDLPHILPAVRFAGHVSDHELDCLFRESDIVCVPSRYESHGVVLLEAMMFGRPIATCDGGGIVEVVDHGRNALVSAPGDVPALVDSLRRLVEDTELRRGSPSLRGRPTSSGFRPAQLPGRWSPSSRR